jgi:hypothetical protein
MRKMMVSKNKKIIKTGSDYRYLYSHPLRASEKGGRLSFRIVLTKPCGHEQ